MRSSPSGFWRQFARESIYGRRGIIKINSLWLPVGLILLEHGGSLVSRPLLRLLLLTVAVICWSFASTLANDLSERSADQAAGKIRWIGLLPEHGAGWIPSVFAAAGLVVLIGAKFTPGTLVTYAAAVILGLAYSLRPFRLKERGALGLASYGLSCAVAYVLIPWTCFGGSPWVVPVLGAAVFLDKWVNLHFHQIVDFEEDRGQGMKTHAVRAGLTKARRSLRFFAALTSLSLAAAAAFTAWILPRIRGPILITVAIVLGLSLFHTIVAGRRPGRMTDLSRELPWTYLGMTLGLFRAVPVILFWELVRRAASLGPAFAVIFVLLATDWTLSYRYRYD